MPSVIRGSDNMDSAIVEQGRAKVWIQFDGTVATPTPANSLNVTSIVDGGTGNYRLVFTSDLSVSLYPALATCNLGETSTTSLTISGFIIFTRNSSGTLTDAANIAAAAFA